MIKAHDARKHFNHDGCVLIHRELQRACTTEKCGRLGYENAMEALRTMLMSLVTLVLLLLLLLLRGRMKPSTS